ncbi:uncharacterized protein LOC119595757 [Penaeus monodon]|uniref:uncharacterized protein LOC119595757 n=1 Tax=Penaeus monodon TaxID=6687 RepID=UPI0018A7D635|nr:uncharacterized protein LOC119595757 [Penaeus monodon]
MCTIGRRHLAILLFLALQGTSALQRDVYAKRSTWWTKRSLATRYTTDEPSPGCNFFTTKGVECAIEKCSDQYGLCSYSARNSADLSHCSFLFHSCVSTCFKQDLPVVHLPL